VARAAQAEAAGEARARVSTVSTATRRSSPRRHGIVPLEDTWTAWLSARQPRCCCADQQHTRAGRAMIFQQQSLLPRLPLLLLAVPLGSGLAARFDAYTTCNSCVGAGFGWSVSKSKCGGYANRDCSQCEAPAVADTSHECSLAMADALRNYTPCTSVHECYGARIHRDLERWRAGGGITRDQFLAAQQKFGMRKLSHYQIVAGQLYRDEKCMFEPRCRGIEYFLHWLLAEDSARGSHRAALFPTPPISLYKSDQYSPYRWRQRSQIARHGAAAQSCGQSAGLQG
jgi:hypothetical protein